MKRLVSLILLLFSSFSFGLDETKGSGTAFREMSLADYQAARSTDLIDHRTVAIRYDDSEGAPVWLLPSDKVDMIPFLEGLQAPFSEEKPGFEEGNREIDLVGLLPVNQEIFAKFLRYVAGLGLGDTDLKEQELFDLITLMHHFNVDFNRPGWVKLSDQLKVQICRRPSSLLKTFQQDKLLGGGVSGLENLDLVGCIKMDKKPSYVSIMLERSRFKIQPIPGDWDHVKIYPSESYSDDNPKVHFNKGRTKFWARFKDGGIKVFKLTSPDQGELLLDVSNAKLAEWNPVGDQIWMRGDGEAFSGGWVEVYQWDADDRATKLVLLEHDQLLFPYWDGTGKFLLVHYQKLFGSGSVQLYSLSEAGIAQVGDRVPGDVWVNRDDQYLYSNFVLIHNDRAEGNKYQFYALTDYGLELLPQSNFQLKEFKNFIWSSKGDRFVFTNYASDYAPLGVFLSIIQNGQVNLIGEVNRRDHVYPEQWSVDGRYLVLWNRKEGGGMHPYLLDTNLFAELAGKTFVEQLEIIINHREMSNLG